MSEFYYFLTREKDNLGAGASWAEDWDVIDALTIKRIYLQKKDGSALTKATFYLKISEDVFTRPYIPAAILGANREVTPILNLPVKAGERISWTLKNNDTAAVSLFLVFECFREKSRV